MARGTNGRDRDGGADTPSITAKNLPKERDQVFLYQEPLRDECQSDFIRLDSPGREEG